VYVLMTLQKLEIPRCDWSLPLDWTLSADGTRTRSTLEVSRLDPMQQCTSSVRFYSHDAMHSAVGIGGRKLSIHLSVTIGNCVEMV